MRSKPALALLVTLVCAIWAASSAYGTDDTPAGAGLHLRVAPLTRGVVPNGRFVARFSVNYSGPGRSGGRTSPGRSPSRASTGARSSGCTRSCPRLPLVALDNIDFLQVGQPGTSVWLGGIDVDDFGGDPLKAIKTVRTLTSRPPPTVALSRPAQLVTIW